ncbi:DNA-processing protein DprA [uncultured Phascolarctobacterium sp.]|jgi:DNA processing protein|uniref:DNA-processing protein DprA n=1 Tax=uncultured Phascolarctobacterium sp. TaxID=512296 RepID=UPI0025F1A44A|nr:DNA-processing protein DprA [uncultured Phascolarctobacterium sp.]
MTNFYLAAVCAVVPGLGRSTIFKLMQAAYDARRIFYADSAFLRSTGICTEDAIIKFISNRDEQLPQRLEHFCRQNGVRLLTLFDEAYPASLKEISDPPLVLYVKGELPTEPYAVAVVGSRSCTAYGERAAAYFARLLTLKGLPIISGGARGIDTAAHKACLEAGGKTVAVLGCGIDIAYPSQNRTLFTKIAQGGGAVISEYAPGMQPLSTNFPARNRIIVGLARAVLVAEAGRRSGAVITANIAADENRDVYCVPGNIFDGTSAGCHELIRNGAKLVEEPQELLDDVAGWQQAMSLKVTQPSIFDCPVPTIAAPKPVIKTTELGKKLLELLQDGAKTLEQLTEGSGVSFALVSMELLDMQVAGLVAQDAAQRYYRR